MITDYNKKWKHITKTSTRSWITYKANTKETPKQTKRTTVPPQNNKLDKNKLHKKEINLLNQGLQHSIEKPLKTYWTNLVMETECAIKLLHVKLQNPFRILASKKLKPIFNSDNQNGGKQKRQEYIIKGINSKLAEENAMIVQADKGKTIVIINTDEYTKKLRNFLTENNFHTLQNDPTKKHHRHLQEILQQSNLVIDKKQIKYLTQKKPQPPTLKAQMKLQKPGNPIRPMINNINALSYKVAQHLIGILN